MSLKSSILNLFSAKPPSTQLSWPVPPVKEEHGIPVLPPKTIHVQLHNIWEVHYLHDLRVENGVLFLDIYPTVEDIPTDEDFFDEDFLASHAQEVAYAASAWRGYFTAWGWKEGDDPSEQKAPEEEKPSETSPTKASA